MGDSLTAYAALYYHQHKYAQAEPLFRRALSIREKALGPEHPDVARSLFNCGLTLHSLKRVDEALEMMRRATEIRNKQEP